MPEPPDFLCQEAVAEWHRQVPVLHKRGMVIALDRSIVAAYCQSYARWRGAEAVLADLGRDDQTGMGGLISLNPKTGRQVPHPMIAICRAAARDVARLASEIGLSPASRLRINAEPPPSADDPGSKYLA
jgi:P27 family predicted phage terminase small subunit